LPSGKPIGILTSISPAYDEIMKAPLPTNEAERLFALREYKVLDTSAEQAYDDITALTAHLCGVPITMISLVDQSRQWFKSKLGLNVRETPRDVAFCAHTILQSEPLVVRDALKDSRFARSALVTRSPQIRFYAGFPLTTKDGFSLGTLCAIDRKPRKLSLEQKRAMQALARQVMALLELRRVSAHLAEALEHVKTLRGLLPICAWCKRVRDDHGYWSQVEAYVHAHTDADFTHGICPQCMTKMRPKREPAGRNGRRARLL
jgi:GAF domain-containing protein